jgi:hypothetical protein
LKNPENKTKGIISTGAPITADFASITILPKIKPNEEPQKEIRNAIRKWSMNWSAVKLNPTIK